jgi:hypothetical protein
MNKKYLFTLLPFFIFREQVFIPFFPHDAFLGAWVIQVLMLMLIVLIIIKAGLKVIQFFPFFQRTLRRRFFNLLDSPK